MEGLLMESIDSAKSSVSSDYSAFGKCTFLTALPGYIRVWSSAIEPFDLTLVAASSNTSRSADKAW